MGKIRRQTRRERLEWSCTTQADAEAYRARAVAATQAIGGKLGSRWVNEDQPGVWTAVVHISGDNEGVQNILALDRLGLL